MKKKVLHIAPYRLTKGGISTVVRQYDEYGIPGGYEILALDSHTDGSKWAKLYVALTAFLKVLRLALFGKPDILHIHVGDFPSIYRKIVVSLPLLLCGVKGVLHLHGANFMAEYEAQPQVGKMLVRWYMGRFEELVCLSESWGRDVQAAFVIPNLTVIFNAVGLPEKFTEKRSENTALHLVFLGLIGWRKGVFDLFEVVAELIHDGYPITLSIGGNGEVERLLASIAREKVQDQVHFLGWTTGEDKAGLLRGCDAMVLPSYAEGMPMSVLEGMSYGLPIVSTRVGGIPELLQEGINGFLIDPGDKGALRTAIVALSESPSERKAMGIASRDRIENTFSYAVHAKKIASVYERVMQTRKTGDRA